MKEVEFSLCYARKSADKKKGLIVLMSLLLLGKEWEKSVWKVLSQILISLLAVLGTSRNCFSSEAGLTAQEVVRRYSHTVACQIFPETSNYRQYLIVELEPPHGTYPSGVWLVAWTGDLGCMGGNGTQSLQLNLVIQNGFSARTVSPVVIDARPIPKLVMNGLHGLHYEDGVVTIQGTIGRANYGTLKQLTVRYRWKGLWTGEAPRFEQLPE